MMRCQACGVASIAHVDATHAALVEVAIRPDEEAQVRARRLAPSQPSIDRAEGRARHQPKYAPEPSFINKPLPSLPGDQLRTWFLIAWEACAT
jgi:hypothetical protein